MGKRSISNGRKVVSEMVTDEEVVKISYEIDDFLMKQVIDNNITPMQLSGMMLARLVRMNEGVKCEDEFYKLVKSVVDRKHLIPEERVLQ
jgi:hypothetical protein